MTPSRPAATNDTDDTGDWQHTAHRVDQLLAQLAATGGFPAGLLLSAFALTGSVAAGSAACPADGSRRSGRYPPELPRLHLELAAVEVADATGVAPAGPGEGLHGSRVDGPTREAVSRLLDHCVGRIQDRLESDGGELGAEQLLGLTRAVLHLEAARRIWQAADSLGPVP